MDEEKKAEVRKTGCSQLSDIIMKEFSGTSNHAFHLVKNFYLGMFTLLSSVFRYLRIMLEV